MHPIILPILGANMTHGTIRAWHKREGDRVEPGEPLFEVETDKVNAEVEAEVGGIVRHIVAPVGARVEILGLVAFVGTADEPLPDPSAWTRLEAAAHPAPVQGPTPVSELAPRASRLAPDTVGPAASPAARRRARERGVALDAVRGSGPHGEITVRDVERAASPAAPERGEGRIDEDFLRLLRTDAGVFRDLPSDAKVELYRRHGACIGDGVRIEPGAIIIAPRIAIGGMSAIGAGSVIECEHLQMGRLSVLGQRARVHARTVRFGDALWAKDGVTIGGGGSNEAGAHFVCGDAAFIGEGAYLNPCRPVTLGDEVCIGARAMLFTHSHWQSILRGYASLFGPIVVGDHVFIGNQAFVFPGVTIGAGATVMVNSFVALNVAPDTLVGGVPAQVIRHIAAPSRAEQIALLRVRMPELAAALGESGHSVSESATGDGVRLETSGGQAVVFAPAWPAALPEVKRTVVLCFVDGELPAVPPNITLFDVQGSRVAGVQDRFSDAVREFCRRRGIRFRPFAWRHGVGHFDGERFVGRE
jgi:acetyltransferase-like isoleucine patch superfamily enzyme